MPAGPRRPEGEEEPPRRRRGRGGDREPGYLERGPGYEKRRPIPNPPAVHREIIARHEGGGEEPPPERVAEARRQWEALPGVLRRPPVDPPQGHGDPRRRRIEP